MRHLRTALGLAVAACLLGALAAPAFAHEFTAMKYKHVISPAEPVKTIGRSPVEEGTQEFTFGKYKIKCKKAVGKGEITQPSITTFESKVRFLECGYYPIVKNESHFPAYFVGTGIQFKFLVDGAIKVEGNEGGEELEYGTTKVEILETAAQLKIPSGKFCTVTIPTQQLPVRSIKFPNETYSDAVYSSDPVEIENQTPARLKLYPGGFQQKVIFAIDLKAIKFKFAEESQCGENEAKTELNSGIWKGTLIQEVTGGNLEFH